MPSITLTPPLPPLKSSPAAHKPSICTMSLGRCFAGHSLPHKLDMAAKNGFIGIEVFYEDLADLASTLPGGLTPENQITAAQTIHDLCAERGQEIIALQPFMHFGGLIDREEHKRRIEELKLWFQLCHALDTNLILFPSSFLPEDQSSGDLDLIIQDFTEAADLGAKATPPIRFAFEALCWGTHVDTWETSWDIVQAVDRENFGICLDSYNILGRIYADPATMSGRNPDAWEETMDSVRRMVSSVQKEKLFLLQVADGERLEEPLTTDHPFYNVEQPTRMSWSRNARLFYGEAQHGGYLPVQLVLAAIVQGIGFEGWLSFEVFNRRLADEEESVPEEMAWRAGQSWQRMVKDLDLRTGEAREVQALL